jgi:hypothetical protein
MLPQSATPQDCWAQVTPLLAGSSFTIATIFDSVVPKITVVVGAVTVTEIALTVIVMGVSAAGSATEVAVTVTVKSVGDGGVVGAV